jgi:hypothetical protein
MAYQHLVRAEYVPFGAAGGWLDNHGACRVRWRQPHMAPVLSASAWVMLARGVVGARIDTSKESRPTPRRLSQSTCTR